MAVVAEKKGSAGEFRWSVRRKTDAVMRLLRGEDLDTVARRLRIEAAAVLPRESLKHDTKLNPNGETWPGSLDEYFFLEPPQPGVNIEVIEWDITLVPHY
jgi:hypothetical protein